MIRQIILIYQFLNNFDLVIPFLSRTFRHNLFSFLLFFSFSSKGKGKRRLNDRNET